MSAQRLKDRVAIVTGAGRGIGRAYAAGIANEGAKIIVADIVEENAFRVKDEIVAAGGEALAVYVDVSNEGSTLRMAREVMERFGKIDILVNNAALFHGIGSRSWDSWSDAEWGRMFAVNVTGAWLCCKAVVPHMVAQGKGKIINVSSDTVLAGTPRLLPYVASKGAIVALTRALASELGRCGINVNCIAPGYTITEATLTMPDDSPHVGEWVIASRCLRRAEQPEDLVGTVVFLASDESDFMTGQMLVVNGGACKH